MTPVLVLNPVSKDLGGGFVVRRLLPAVQRQAVGPFLFFDHFGPLDVRPGDDHDVRAHPHIGLATVTYLFEGAMLHRDSLGVVQRIEPGAINWMTAGRGIVHAERPLADGTGEVTQHGIQLWTSLPRALKMAPPRYQRLEAADIAEKRLPGATLRVVGGEISGARGPAGTLMPAFVAHVAVDPGAAISLEVAACFEAAAYVIAGEGAFGLEGVAASTGELVVFADEGGPLEARNAGPGRLDLMVIGGEPAEGPLVFHGPFVMNSVEQARAADIAYRTGRMGSLA